MVWLLCPENYGLGVKEFRMSEYEFSGDGPSRSRCSGVCGSGSSRLFRKETRGHGGYDYRVGVLECYPPRRIRGPSLRSFIWTFQTPNPR